MTIVGDHIKVDWDLQTFIEGMHKENKDSIKELSTNLKDATEKAEIRQDKIMATLIAHERSDMIVQHNINLRLEKIEAVMGNLKWFARTGIAAILTMIADLVLHHAGKL